MPLIDFVTQKNAEQALLISKDTSYTGETLTNARKQHLSLLKELSDKSVVVAVRQTAALAKWLILLDGVVQRITILPPELNPDQNFWDKTEATVLLTDTEPQSIDIVEVINIGDLTSDEGGASDLPSLETEWILATSGTTGTPKLVQHTLKSLTKTTKFSTKRKEHVWGLLYSLTRFAGLQVFLQAIAGGTPLIITDESDALGDRIALFAKHGVDCISATPTLWRKILMLPEAKELNMYAITLGGEVCDAQILNALSTRFPTAKLRHIYASTEAGVGFSVTDGLPGFPKDFLDGKLPGISMKLGTDQTLLIKSDAKASQYLGQDNLDIEEGYIDTGDVIEIDGDRCYFKGRLNGAINVGGNKVQPEYIEQVLMSYSGVELARVTAKANSIMGNLVYADIMVASSVSDEKQLITDLRKYCYDTLEKFMVPASFKVVDDIQLSATGKISRK